MCQQPRPYRLVLITDAEGSRVVRFSPPFVCLLFRPIYQKRMQLGQSNLTIKLNIQMFHDESWKLIYFGGQKVKGRGHESQKHCRRWSLHSCECWLLLAERTGDA